MEIERTVEEDRGIVVAVVAVVVMAMTVMITCRRTRSAAQTTYS